MTRRSDMRRRNGTVNRDWREVIDDGVIRLSLPYQHGFVNSYLILGQDGPRLIDTGGPEDVESSQLVAHLAAFGWKIEDVKAILLTHAHQDHVGMAATIANASGATVFIHAQEVLGSAFAHPQPPLQWLRQHGLPLTSGNLERKRSPLPQRIHVLNGDEMLRFGPLELQLYWTPGHSPGLICAHERERGWLFTSDHLLRAPTPVAIRQHLDADPVHEYLDSLGLIAELPAKLALPGHGRSFKDVGAVILATKEAQLQWVEEVYEAVPSGGAVAMEIAQRLTWLAARDPAHTWLAISRSVAYLHHLEAGSRLRRKVGSVVEFVPVVETTE